MKKIVERRTKKALTGAGADKTGVNDNDDANSAGANEVVDLMMKGMEVDMIFKESAIGVFLSL